MDKTIKEAKAWIQEFIIKLNICPFAGTPYFDDKIRFVVCECGENFEELKNSFLQELVYLDDHDEVSNTLIVIKDKLSFEDYLDAYYFLEELITQGNLQSLFQLASFHPNYQYADTKPDDPSNKRNQSPYPMIHILRVAEVEAAIVAFGDTSIISQENIDKLLKLHAKEN